jgi:hypothetical protein
LTLPRASALSYSDYFLDPEDGGGMFLEKSGCLNYIALKSRRLHSSGVQLDWQVGHFRGIAARFD